MKIVSFSSAAASKAAAREFEARGITLAEIEAGAAHFAAARSKEIFARRERSGAAAGANAVGRELNADELARLHYLDADGNLWRIVKGYKPHNGTDPLEVVGETQLVARRQVLKLNSSYAYCYKCNAVVAPSARAAMKAGDVGEFVAWHDLAKNAESRKSLLCKGCANAKFALELN